jgi:hypothetical protein
MNCPDDPLDLRCPVLINIFPESQIPSRTTSNPPQHSTDLKILCTRPPIPSHQQQQQRKSVLSMKLEPLVDRLIPSWTFIAWYMRVERDVGFTAHETFNKSCWFRVLVKIAVHRTVPMLKNCMSQHS